jgi:hypothetical protein
MREFPGLLPSNLKLWIGTHKAIVLDFHNAIRRTKENPLNTGLRYRKLQNQTIMNEDNNNDLLNVNYNDYIQNKTKELIHNGLTTIGIAEYKNKLLNQ